MTEPLSLRDIHMPTEVNWWPIAPGWWLLILVSLFFFLLAYKKYRQRRQIRRSWQIVSQSLELFAGLQKYSDDIAFIKGISALLRRTAISLYGKEETAGLSGQAWLQFLDDKSRSIDFTQGAGKVLIDQPYRKHAVFDREELIRVTKKWLLMQGKPGV